MKFQGFKLNQIQDREKTNPGVMQHTIPKIVHQTFPTKNLPPKIADNIQSLKALNPDWEFKLYDDNDIEAFILKNYPEMLSYYHRIDSSYGPARADFFRYLLIYKEGGVYLDIKSSLTKRLNNIVTPETQYILAHWSNNYGRHPWITNVNGEYQQWHVIAVAGHPFLKAVIENVCRNIEVYNPLFHERGFSGVLRTTGPIAYTLAIIPLLDAYPHQIDYDENFGLVYSIFQGNSTHEEIFKTRYRKLNNSVIAQPWYIALLFRLLGGLIDKFKKWLYQ